MTSTQVQPRRFDEAWARVLAQYRNRPAILRADGAPLRTFAAIEEERRTWRDTLGGLPPRSAVIGQLGNAPGWPALFLACLDLELALVPVEGSMPVEQSSRIAALTQARAVVRTGQAVEVFERDRLGWDEPAPALLKITSGTTGLPRAVCCRESHLVADCRNICATMGIRPDDTNFGVIPFSHSYGFSNLVTPLLWQGTRLVCAYDRLPRALHQQLRTSGSTVFPGTPALFQALAGLPETEGLGQVRLCISAGAPLAPEVARQFARRYGLAIHSFYGSSECGGIAYDRVGRQDQPTGFAGTPMDGVEVRLLEGDRIEVCGPNVADGYFPIADPEVLDGVRFRPGDLVASTEAGLRLYGRVSDFINVAGKKLHPSMVEEHLRRYPGVIDAVVFGIPSPNRNEELIAYVVAGPAVTRSQVEEHCRAALSGWQVPRDILVVPELPVNDRGKLSRAELARVYLERHQTGAGLRLS
ncbi:MAG: acyl--CoA ligase [Verrucomicrobia bacterium]|nr:acyl--CoA ligase [Verrucomicrobiota bacterium]